MLFVSVFVVSACSRAGTAGVPTEIIASEVMDHEAMDDEAMEDDMAEEGMATTSFTIRIENVSPSFPFSAGGVFNTPETQADPGPLAPGSRLSCATAFVQSNDWLFAPDEQGIALFDADGNPLSGDLTHMIYLWNAGAEADQPHGVGPEQALRQANPATGAAENGTVELSGNDT